MIPRLLPGMPFPPVRQALRGPFNGLLAATLELTPERLLEAYRQGIFPWYEEGEPVLWWSPDPRMVLPTAGFRVSRSLRRQLRRALVDPELQIRCDHDFRATLAACASPRARQAGTWITRDVATAYAALNAREHAHSIEVYRSGTLVGGLYGVSIGRMFYGESMFARETDASKIALAALVRILLEEGFPVIDCQQNTRHLASLGASEIPRASFCAQVRELVDRPPPRWANWRGRELKSLFAELPEPDLLGSSSLASSPDPDPTR